MFAHSMAISENGDGFNKIDVYFFAINLETYRCIRFLSNTFRLAIDNYVKDLCLNTYCDL